MKVCIVGISGKLGQYMTQHALDRGYEVVGVCREKSVGKLDRFSDRITVYPGATDDREVIRRAVGGCDGVLWCSRRGARTATRPVRPRRCSTTRRWARGWCSPAAGTSAATARTATRV